MKQIKKNMNEKMDLTVVNKMSEFGYEIHKAGCRDLKNKRNVMDHKFPMVSNSGDVGADFCDEMRENNLEYASDNGESAAAEKLSSVDLNKKYGYGYKIHNCVKKGVRE